MSRTLHDEFAKDWMKEFLADFGQVETDFQISGEVRHVDVYFEPDPALLPAPMGLLGQMITAPCLIEPFRNAISVEEICNCTSKATILGRNLARQAKREKRRFRFSDRPFLWMITPTLSAQMARNCSLYQHPKLGEGIYLRAKSDKAGLIVIHHLPCTIDTLWLRLLGRDNVQKQAIKELLDLAPDHPYRDITLRHIAVLQKNLRARQNITRDLQEVIMTLSITYAQFSAEIDQKIEQGIEQGQIQGRLSTQQEIARELLKDGMEPATVARLTKLPLNQLPQLDA
jgi:hypothetical protein